MNPYKSALNVLPIVFDTIGCIPDSMLDVGCGDGSWMKAAYDLGVREAMLGIDRKPEQYIQCGGGRADYLQVDLNGLIEPLVTEYHPDFCICVEVAEHLRPTSAEPLVTLLTKASPVVLFSAAPPGQGPYGEEDNPGVHHNEQPPEYWHGLFDAQGFQYIDIHNRLVEAQDNIDPWYVANAGLYIKRVEI